MTRVEPIQERAENTRETLVEHALSLVLRHGVENVTTSMVTRAAGKSVGVFYRYFENMGDVVHEFGLSEGQGVSRIAAHRALLEASRRRRDPEAEVVPITVDDIVARLTVTKPEDDDYLVVLAAAGARLALIFDDTVNPLKEN